MAPSYYLKFFVENLERARRAIVLLLAISRNTKTDIK